MPHTTTLLWTGGWDSTFRLLQLLFVEKRNVQPIYVVDDNRYSTMRELEAMSAIVGMVRKRLSQEVTLYPRTVFIKSDFPDNQELKDRFIALKEKNRIGSQYYWLAVIAEHQKWRSVELSMERWQTPSGLQRAIFNDIEGEQPTLVDSWEAELFKYWSFPLLTTTKAQMRKIAEEYDFLDILLKRWFCLRPIRGKCCGVCRPCMLARQEGATDDVKFIHPTEIAARELFSKIRKRIKHVAR